MDKNSTSKKRKKINYNAKNLFNYYRKQKELNNNKDVYSTELRNFVIKFIERTLPEYDGCNSCGGEMTDMLLHDFYKNKISDKELIKFIIENSGINNFYLIEDDLEEIEKYNNIAINILVYVVENILTKCSFVYDRIGCEFYITKDIIKEITEQLEQIGGEKAYEIYKM